MTINPHVHSKKGDSLSQYKVYKVENGDTLTKIAYLSNMSIKDLKSINDLYDEQVYPGQSLLVTKPSLIQEKDVKILEETNDPNGYDDLYKKIQNENLSLARQSTKTQKVLTPKDMENVMEKLKSNNSLNL